MTRFRAVALATFLATTGCYHIQYVRRVPPEAAPVLREWHHTFVFGIVEGSSPVDVTRACPGGFAVVDTRETLATSVVSSTPLLAAAAVGVWTTGVFVPLDGWSPIAIDVTCASPWSAAPLAAK